MKEAEGVIKYTLKHHHQTLEKNISIAEINAWRTLLFKLGLIGQIKGRYDDYGFGNISHRITQTNTDKAQFIISGTQTGSCQTLLKHQYCTVLEADSEKNSIKSSGEIKPSSEALTHASLYQWRKTIQSVIHIHCPEIWNNTKELKLPHTSAAIAYGTPEMAYEVERLLQTKQLNNTSVFSMLGHEDGVIAFSDSMEKAGCSIIKCYAKAISLEQS